MGSAARGGAGGGGGTAPAASRPCQCQAGVAGAEPEINGTSVPRVHCCVIWGIKRGMNFPECVACFVFNSFSQGLGCGLLYTATVTITCQYFDKRRGLALGLISTGMTSNCHSL